MLYKISYIGYDSLFSEEDISFIQLNKISLLVYQIFSISDLFTNIYDILIKK